MNIEEIVQAVEDIVKRYGLKILYMDYTDITIISRVGLSPAVFIQIYVNAKKEKINMALVVGSERIYGADKEGGFYHEHPFENPSMHVGAERVEIEDFVVKSLELLNKINLL
ncbi:MAG: hypothetical protein Q8M34_07785 [Thermodesulfovibrionales bacterium]|nr:hypothetical protein [Thermodesulfovibrionales bacterium]